MTAVLTNRLLLPRKTSVRTLYIARAIPTVNSLRHHSDLDSIKCSLAHPAAGN